MLSGIDWDRWGGSCLPTMVMPWHTGKWSGTVPLSRSNARIARDLGLSVSSRWLCALALALSSSTLKQALLLVPPRVPLCDFDDAGDGGGAADDAAAGFRGASAESAAVAGLEASAGRCTSVSSSAVCRLASLKSSERAAARISVAVPAGQAGLLSAVAALCPLAGSMLSQCQCVTDW